MEKTLKGTPPTMAGGAMPKASRFAKAGHFLRHKGGNVAITTALIMTPLLVTVGAAVDVAEMYRARVNFQNATDAAALAAAKTLSKGGTAKEAQAAGERMFAANLGNLKNSTGSIKIDTNGGECTTTGVTATAKLRHPMFFDGVRKAFQDSGDPNHANLNAATTVKCGNDSVEIALVLDNSGSMGSNNKIGTLKEAARNMVNTLHDSMASSLKPKPVQFSLVPFAATVNVGSNNKNASWMDRLGKSSIHHENLKWEDDPNARAVSGGFKDKSGRWLTRQTLYDNLRISWSGCVEMRPHPYSTTDDTPKTSKPDTLFVPTFAPDTPDHWNGKYEKNIGTVSTGSQYYCTRWRRNRTCKRWNDGHRKTVHWSGARANYYSAEYGGRGRWQGGSTTQAWVDGNRIYEEDYDNNYLEDSHNWPYADASQGPHYRDKQFTGTGTDQHKRQFWTWKYFNNPRVYDVNRNRNGFPSEGGPNSGCTTRAITDLTDSRSQVLTAINNMRASGFTNVLQGFGWGWRTLSPGTPFTRGRSYAEEDNKKILIIMTDGNHVYPNWGDGRNLNKSGYGAFGYGQSGHTTKRQRIFEGFDAIKNPSQNGGTWQKAMDEHLVETCANAKAAGIQVYSIAFDVRNGSSVKTMLENCASPAGGGLKLYYDARDKQSLLDAFENIAEKIAELAISK
ncbi:MAG: TadE/TadG family type IV pilus assembly protein [Pseudomonadota bacterium]